MDENNEVLDTISVVIPVFNEKDYIERFIKSVLQQEYDFEKVELIFIDGNSTDNTVDLIKKNLSNVDINYKILINPEKTIPKSLNIGIKNSHNSIIIRLDAHSEYSKNYFERCVYYINNIDADNVGCNIETQSDEKIVGKAISEVLSSPFGVGNSKFRTNSKSGYVDTVPFGTFKQSLFEKIGYFDERLDRNEDSEFNNRIIKNGGKIYLFDDTKNIYHPRNTIKKLIKMALSNGKWNIYTSYLIPGSMKLRHFIPFIFVISIIFGLIATVFNIFMFKELFIIEMLIYIFMDLLFSIKSMKKVGIMQGILCIMIYPLFHIFYGIGSILGIGKIIKSKK